jgi:Family of unknown function (DUF6166)
MKTFRGYRKGQEGGGCLVTVRENDGDERVMGLPVLLPTEGRHSPDGFQWGYGGSGPAELARAILIEAYPGDELVRHPRCYQAFKFSIIAGLKYDEWTLTTEEIAAWRYHWARDHPEVSS